MKIFIGTLLTLLISSSSFAQHVSLPNPIMFVAQVPVPRDSCTVGSVSCNHLADVMSAPRGGDLYILYPDGALKNITQSAGYGMSGMQGANAIAVREPSVHWSGKKAVFSMVVGAPTAQGQQGTYHWQIYEVTNLGETETPLITKVPNQPTDYNNVSPIYGTDERIIFTSDRPRDGLTQLYPLLDEHNDLPSITGLWSIDTTLGDLFQLDFAPSGAFSPFIDSYGRVVFTRWDHLTTDPNADSDALGLTHKGSFIYVDESPGAAVRPNTNVPGYREIFPECETFRHDLLNGIPLKGLDFNEFFPWQINEDGTSEETLNHVGRHDLLASFGSAVNNDSNVYDFTEQAAVNRVNKPNHLQNFIQIAEDPTSQGLYYGISFLDLGQHASGQIVTLDGRTILDPAAMKLNYITDSSTERVTPEGGSPDPNHSGHYRNPLPLTNGRLLAVHAPTTYGDKNSGTRSHPLSRYDFRIKTLKNTGTVWVADSLVTPGISKTLSYWDPDTLVTYSGPLWELNPVEIKPRAKPTRRSSTLGNPEKQIFIEEGVDETSFRNDLKQKNAGLIVSRNITHRDKSDHQQPYYLRVPGTKTISANPHGTIYDILNLYLFQADQIRSVTLGNPNPVPGRRVLAQYMHDDAVSYNHYDGSTPYVLTIGTDGSFAAYVPARRAIVWGIGLTDPVVGERYWITTQPGEIRVCASCHGTNDEALAPLDPAPQNKPEALRSLLRYWKLSHTPLVTQLISPPNDSTGIPINASLDWFSVSNAKTYQVSISATQDFSQPLFVSPSLTDTKFTYPSFHTNTSYYWRVLTFDGSGDSAYSGIWKFTTGDNSAVQSSIVQNKRSLSNYPNPFNGGTTISYTLPESEAIKLKVFTILGAEVTTLVDGFIDAGRHSIYWDGTHLPNGSYFLRLQDHNGVVLQTMRLLH
jgi:hypothetical protein